MFGIRMRNIVDSLRFRRDLENVEQGVSGTIFREAIETGSCLISEFFFEAKMSRIRRRKLSLACSGCLVWCGRDGESRVKFLQNLVLPLRRGDCAKPMEMFGFSSIEI